MAKKCDQCGSYSTANGQWFVLAGPVPRDRVAYGQKVSLDICSVACLAATAKSARKKQAELDARIKQSKRDSFPLAG